MARLVEKDPSSKSALQRRRRSGSSSRCRATGCACLLRAVPQEESQLRSTALDGCLLRLRAHPPGLLGRSPVCDDPFRRGRRSGQSGSVGSAPFFATLPHGLVVQHPAVFLLLAVLGLVSGLSGWTFKSVLYRMEDSVDALWRGRPQWARPAVGGLALGALLLAVPEMYGVGYPVMERAVEGQYVLWFLLVLLAAKIVATSMTLSIGGSGGVFAPSLFIGVMTGTAYGSIIQHVFGHAVSSPAVFAVVAMGGVFGAAAQAPLTATASALEMTGKFQPDSASPARRGHRDGSFQAPRHGEHLHDQVVEARYRH